MRSNYSRGFFRMAVAASFCFILSINAFAEDEPLPMTNLTISCELTHDCSPIGVAIHTEVHVDHPTPGHEYALKYQLRVLQNRRYDGPILGNAAFPNGVALDLDQSIGKTRYQFGNFNLEGDVDITRDNLREMTNVPTNQPSSEILIGFQPQIYNTTDKSYLTTDDLSPVMFVVSLDSENRVHSITGLYRWIASFRGGLMKTRYDERSLDRLKRIVEQIGEVQASKSALPFAFNHLLVGLEVPDETMLEVLNCIRPEWVVVGKLGLESELILTLEDLRNQSDNPKIQERIDALIAGGVID